MIRRRNLKAKTDLGYVGDIVRVDTETILNALQNGYIPSSQPFGWGEDGTV
jgi:acetylglutamate kinase